MTRRDLVQKIVIGGTTFIVIPSFFTQCSKPEDEDPNLPSPSAGGGNSDTLTIDLSSAAYSVLNNPGGNVLVQGIIIANLGSNFVALNSICTHEGCTIGFNPSSNTFPCPCHGSVYSSTGAVINGPATRGVKSYTIVRNGNILTITL